MRSTGKKNCNKATSINDQPRTYLSALDTEYTGVWGWWGDAQNEIYRQKTAIKLHQSMTNQELTYQL